MSHVVIIAEAGVNHNGDLLIAKQLIDAAKSAGANYVKFQTFSADRLVTKYAKLADYQKEYSGDISQFELLKKLELNGDELAEIVAYTKSKDIGFLSTGFDVQSLVELNKFDLDLIKIPSGEINNYPYLKFVGSQGKPVILSTGMATNTEISDAIDVLLSAGSIRSDITVLHCTSEYPAPFEDVNLNAMDSIQTEHSVNVGYSDHTRGIEVAIAAVAKGAKLIEKHFTLDRNMEGPDHKASIDPDELLLMVQSIRNIEKALGDGKKKPMMSELKNKAIVRKSIVASQAISAGEIFSEENLDTKRPGNGISPMMWNQVIGQLAVRDFQKDEMIEL